ncbi:hypothetical protein BTO20_13015 [Mycobacterium dioxanotrophicus]|uniref:Uncharacterized protein n=1 Tax=Mycobacterium dioxanotrophicus TaxID=482462 RepID=A0A1Y0C2I6_9MYCO|nr:hypothetical protein [Mycobacterium dioxanotrophicus]ART69381.1 hypothetical protein BTO20_13015 [Mycobacterium dioxanotrophicus]
MDATRRIGSVGALAVALGAVVVLGAGSYARADPEPGPAPPQAGSGCGENFDGALTALPQPAAETGTAKDLLRCTGGTWAPYLDPYPASDRWLTTGSGLILHGQGRRNPEVHAGTWTGTPQTDETTCRAEVVDVLAPGETSSPEFHAADPGRPLTLEVGDHLFMATLTGYCLWQRG